MRRGTTALVAILVLLGAACTTTTTTSTDPGDFEKVDLPDDLLHVEGAAARALADIEERVGLSPAQVTDISIYPEYMIVEAQDPDIPDHIDSYTWRDGNVERPTPVHLSGPQEDVDASLYPTTAVDLGDIWHIVRTAEEELEHAEIRVEQARATYLYIQRDSSLDGRVVVTISISGPRRSGTVETTSSGEILEATVS